MAKGRVGSLAWLRKRVEEADTDLLREMVKVMAEMLMSAEADSMCGAEYGERSTERVNRRNGHRSRLWDARAGTINLEIPKLRKGSYFPSWLIAPRRLAECAPFAGNDRVLRARSLHPPSGWVSYEVGACRDLQEPAV